MNRELPSFADVEDMLTVIPSDERDIWIRVGMALRRSYGDDAFDLWNNWSSKAPSYNARSMRTHWRSFRGSGGVTIGSLIYLAKQYGWAPRRQEPSQEDKQRAEDLRREAARRRERLAQEEKKEEERRQRAHDALVHQTNELMSQANYEPHPYLEAKGFGMDSWLVYGGKLLLPMRHFVTREIVGHQTIDRDGAKNFPFATKAAEAVFRLQGRNARSMWLCEGFATGWSIRSVMEEVGISPDVVVCFSAQNIRAVARHMRNKRYFDMPVFVVADHDKSRCRTCDHNDYWPFHEPCPKCGEREAIMRNPGERVARETGLPYWMSPTGGQDANDFMLEAGRDALRRLLLRLEVRAGL